jgi:glycosyltransferase involved in cell wall biosynthesis
MGKKRKKPTVIIGSPTYLPRQGGSATYFSNLMKKLNKKVNFVVYTCTVPGLPRYEKIDGYEIYRIQPFLVDHPKIIRYPILPWFTFFQVFRLHMKYRPVIFHAHACGAYGYLISLYSKIFGIPQIKEVQDMSDAPYIIHMGKNIKWVSTGYTIEKQLIKFGVPKKDIITYPSLNPEIPPEKLKKLKPKEPKDGGKIELLCIAALRPYKGVDYLLQSMKIVQKEDKNIHCTVVGEGGMREELEAYIKKHKLKNVTLRGFVESYDDLLKMMATCDALVLSSVSDEGNPRVILESFQFSRPVIASAAGGTPELIEDGVSGILTKPKDYKAFAEAILKVSHDAKMRKKLGRGGKKFSDALPTWQDLADEIYGEYFKIWKKY